MRLSIGLTSFALGLIGIVIAEAPRPNPQGTGPLLRNSAGRQDSVRPRRTRSTTRIPVVKGEVAAVSPFDTLEFPWPPPKWSARVKLPTAIADPTKPESLGSIADRIDSAFRRAEIQEYAVYTIGESGFAYLSRLERIDATGKPLAGANRWPTEVSGDLRTRGIVEYFKSLFVATPGYYRVIAIVASPRPIVQGEDSLSAEQAGQLVRGPQILPRDVRARKIPGVYATALIYEFQATKAETAPKLIVSAVPPIQHLVLAGLWPQTYFGR